MLRWLPVLAIVLPAFTPARAAADPCRIGINPGAPVWEGQVVLDEERAKAIASAGAATVRIDFRAEGSGWDEAALARYDDVLAAVEAAGLEPYGLVAYEAIGVGQAEWNDDPDGDGLNDAVVEYADTVQLLVERFGDRVHRWELWNEPNCWAEPSFATDPRHAGCTYVLPRVLAKMLAESYLRIGDRLESGEIEIVTGGLFTHEIGGPLSTGSDYLLELYQDGVWGWLDENFGRRYPWSSLGVHIYLDQDRITDGARMLQVLDVIGDLAAAHGDHSPFAITEIGWTTAAVGPEVQASNLDLTYALLGGRADVDEVSWFSYSDAPAADLFFGIVENDGTPKPALAAMQARAAACDGVLDDGGKGDEPPTGGTEARGDQASGCAIDRGSPWTLCWLVLFAISTRNRMRADRRRAPTSTASR